MFIENSLRLPLLTVEWIFTILSLELSLLFILKFFRQEKQQRSSRELGYASLFFGISLMWFFLILGDYFMSESIQSPFLIWSQGSERHLFINLGYLSLTIGALLFSFSMEKQRLYLFKRYLFTGSFFTLMLISLISFLINLDILQDIALITWLIVFIFWTIFFVDFFKSGLKKENPTLNIVKFLSTFVFITIGFFFSTELFISFLGLEIRLLGSGLQLISMGILAYFFIKLPPLVIADWKQKLEDIYIINNAGLCLIYQSFLGGDEDLTTEHVRSGALASINIILKSLSPSQKEGIAVIKKKGKTMTIYTGELSTGVIVSSEELGIIKSNLKKLIQKFESIYYNVLLHFRADTDVFYPMRAIIKDYFA